MTLFEHPVKSVLIFCLLAGPIAAHAQSESLSLESALEKARSNRSVIQSAKSKVEQARLQRRASGSAPATTLSLGYTSDIRTGGTDDDLVLSQPLDIFGRTAASRKTGDATVLRAEASYRQVSLTLQDEVFDLYVDSVGASQRLAIAKEAEATASRLLEAVRSLVEGGRLPGVQATRVSIELQKAVAERKQREVDLAANLKRLQGAVGIDTKLTVGDFPGFGVREVTEKQLASQRSDLLMINAQIAEAEAAIQTAEANRKPQLELQARKTPWQQSDSALGARIQFSFPIFDSGRGRIETAVARKESESARHLFADTARIARAEVEAAEIEAKGTQEQLSSLEDILKTNQSLVERTELGLKEGANTLIDLLDALRSLREVQESIVDAKVAAAKASGEYLKATGAILEVAR